MLFKGGREGGRDGGRERGMKCLVDLRGIKLVHLNLCPTTQPIAFTLRSNIFLCL